MAQFQSIAAAGRSLQRYLNHCFAQDEPVTTASTRAVLVRTEDLSPTSSSTAIGAPALSMLLYRVDFNRTMRAAWSAVGHQDGRAHLPLDLHYLLTAWALNAEDEHRILGRTMQCMETNPHLSGPLLDPAAGWAAGEGLQVSLAEISTEDVMRTFDTLPLDYKLSLHYVVRVVRVDQADSLPDPRIASATTRIKAEVTP